MNAIPETTALDRIPLPPSAALLGWRLQAHDADRGWVRVRYEGKREFLNPAGCIQGGIQAAMLDDCMGPAAFIASGGQMYPATIDMSVSDLAPAKPGPLYAEGAVVRLGGTVAFLEGRLFDGAGQLLARATASARLVPTERAVA
jgi:uncharacterized protein (TIGR00369 family)